MLYESMNHHTTNNSQQVLYKIIIPFIKSKPNGRQPYKIINLYLDFKNLKHNNNMQDIEI